MAYVVAHVADDGGAGLSTAALRQALADRLPAYMVPAGFVQLAALPLTPNGKVDRRWLAESGPRETEAGGAIRVVPRTAAEEILEGIFSSVLGIDDLNGVGAEADFFALGGHSLLATQLVSRLRAAFGIELPLRAVFEHPTVAGLAARLTGTAALPAPPHPADRSRSIAAADLPLSFAQQRLWFIDQLEGGSLYNMPIALRVEGELSVAVLARTLQEVVRRHEALRTVFPAAGGRARQVILPPAGLAVPLVDLTGLCPALRQPVAVGLVTAEARRPFDLARGPLLRAGLWRLGETEHLLLLAMHHIVSDGWSLGVLVREVTALYAALSEDTEACRRRFPSCRCSTRTSRPGSGAGSPGTCWMASSGTGASVSPGRRRFSSCRPTGRAPRCRASAARSAPSPCRAELSAGSHRLFPAGGSDSLHDAGVGAQRAAVAL